MIETHCHLTHERLRGDEPSVIAAARAAGVEACISIGTGVEDARRVSELCGRHEGFVFGTAGLDPFSAHDSGDDFDAQLSQLENLLEHGSFVAVGEIGLDYYHLPKDPIARVRGRLMEAKQAFPAKLTKDFSYTSTQLAGDGWVLVGDAYGFLDPVYSSGLFLALKSGEMAADCILEAFEDNDFSGDRLGGFQKEYIAGMESIRKLVYAFYTRGFSFGKFLKAHPECQKGIIDILSGNVYRTDVTSIFEPMAEMCNLSADVI